MTSHIPDKGQVTVRYFGLYANAHRGKIKKAIHQAFPLRPAVSMFFHSLSARKELSAISYDGIKRLPKGENRN
jgi:hypothetical protein